MAWVPPPGTVPRAGRGENYSGTEHTVLELPNRSGAAAWELAGLPFTGPPLCQLSYTGDGLAAWWLTVPRMVTGPRVSKHAGPGPRVLGDP
jgi:hypothetical protein